jgi:dephospho-CoA kinase
VRICITGKARSGKDTISDYLVEKYNFKKFSFANGLKIMSSNLFPNEFKEGKPRKLLQDVATITKEIDKDIWINYCFREIKENTISRDHIVISDLRSRDELEKVVEEGFCILKVQSNPEIIMKRIEERRDKFNLSDLNHHSETALDEFPYDFLLENNGSFEELYEQVDQVIKNLNKK